MSNFGLAFGVSRKSLLIIASVVWFLAGGLLIFRGVYGILNIPAASALKVALSVVLGLVFYFSVFKRISLKHINRIKQMQSDKLPFYSFFPTRSFVIMMVMMSMGISLKISGVLPESLMVYFFPVMGLPLFISAFRFLKHGCTFT